MIRRAPGLLALLLLAACGGASSPPTSEPGGGGTTSGGDPFSGGGDPGGGDPFRGGGDPFRGGGDPGGSPATGLSADAAAILAAHNDVRAGHCVPPLTWSAELATVAQAWADQLRDQGCAFEHSQTRYGENLAAGTSGYLTGASSVAMWYREVDLYDYARPGFSMQTGHFTQVIWRNTERVGCGSSTCNGMTTWVCNYDPAGNFQGEYPQQVPPPC